MSTGDIHVNQTAADSSNVTQIGVQYTGGIHQHYAPGSEPKRTTVTLDLGLEQVDVSKLIALISGLTQSGVQDINLVGVRLGSLIVTLEMPSNAAYTLGHLALTRPDLFAEFKLRSVSVDLPPPSGAAIDRPAPAGPIPAKSAPQAFLPLPGARQSAEVAHPTHRACRRGRGHHPDHLAHPESARQPASGQRLSARLSPGRSARLCREVHRRAGHRGSWRGLRRWKSSASGPVNGGRSAWTMGARGGS